MPQKQVDQLDRGRLVIDRPVPVRAACRLAGHVVLAYRADIHLDTLLVGRVLVLDPAREANVPDAELPVVDGSPLTLNPEDDGQHIGVSVLRQVAGARHVVDIPVHVVAGFLGRLGQHVPTLLVSRLNGDRHGEPLKRTICD